MNRKREHILWDPILAEKGGYKHFMLKEIFEQPRSVRDTTLGRVGQETGRIFLDEMDIAPSDFARFTVITTRSGASEFFHDLDRETEGSVADMEKIVMVATRHGLTVPPPPST